MSSVGSAIGGLISGVTQPIVSILGGSAGSAAAAGVTAGASLEGVSETNQANLQELQQTEDFSQNMANTVFERTVPDMEKAGINPMLAASSQNPSPSASPVPLANELGTAMNAGISNFSALQSAQQTAASTDNIKAQTNLNNVLSAKAAADTTTALSQAQYTNAMADKVRSGSLMSDVIGSDAAAKTSSYLNSAMDNVSSKISSLISGTTASSAASADAQYGPISIHKMSGDELNQKFLDIFDPQ